MVRFHDKYCMPLNIKYLKLYKSDIKPLVDFSFFFFFVFFHENCCVPQYDNSNLQYNKKKIFI